MALFVYAPVIKTGTRELIEALGAKRLVRFDGMNFVHKGTPLTFNEKEDTIICWGACVPPLGNLRIFNKNLLFSSHLQMNTAIGNMVCMVPAWRFIQIGPYAGVKLPGEFYVRDPRLGNLIPFEGSSSLGQIIYESRQEYRLTVFGDEIIKTEKKYPMFKNVHNPDFGPFVPGQMSHRFIRSNEAGWEWKPCKEKLENVPAAIKQIQQQIGLEFFVASVLTPTNDAARAQNFSYLRKISTGPELDADDVQMYLNLIQKWIKANGGSIVP